MTNTGDITGHKSTEGQIRFQARLLDAVGQAIIATNQRGTIIYWNRASEEMLERAEEIMSELRAGRSWSGEFVVQRKDGSTFPAMVTDTPVRDEQGNLAGIIGVSTDISERKALEEELERRASHDPLTGLPNRRAFVDRLGQALRRTRRRKNSRNKV